jgi:UPF0755 protein
MIEAPGPLAAARTVVVPHGTPGQVGEVLKAAGVISNADAFRIAASLGLAGRMHAAELAFPEHASLRQVFAVLRSAKPVQHKITIPEGLTAIQIGKLLAKGETLTGDLVTPPEGAVLPQTYAYEYGATRASVVERATAAMQRTLAQAWATKAEKLPIATPLELETIASLVERETARPEERSHIAGVLYNRLRKNMRLQSDPSVVYAVSNGAGTLEHPLTRADLDIASPYNTYRVNGLPPGPIASPGGASIQAAAQPDVTEDLYYVADGTGGHAFARTLEDHQKNVARWRALNPNAPALLP